MVSSENIFVKCVFVEDIIKLVDKNCCCGSQVHSTTLHMSSTGVQSLPRYSYYTSYNNINCELVSHTLNCSVPIHLVDLITCPIQVVSWSNVPHPHPFIVSDPIIVLCHLQVFSTLYSR